MFFYAYNDVVDITQIKTPSLTEKNIMQSNKQELNLNVSAQELILDLNTRTKNAGYLACWDIDRRTQNIYFSAPSVMYLAFNEHRTPLSNQYTEFLPKQLLKLLGDQKINQRKHGQFVIFSQTNCADVLRALNLSAQEKADVPLAFFKPKPEPSAAAADSSTDCMP
jgi:hypothetical protein